MFYYDLNFDQPGLDSWNVASATKMSLMFFRTPFRHSLCSWGAQLSARGQPAPDMSSMFFSNTGCDNTTDPDNSAAPWGPFCFNC